MTLSELEHALDVALMPATKRLALAHITFAEFLDDILQCGALKPTYGVAYAGSYSGIEELFERIGYHF
jgi:hypothetical protein